MTREGRKEEQLELELEAARTTCFVLGECFCSADDDSAEETACLKASIAQDLRVSELERALDPYRRHLGLLRGEGRS